MDFLLEALTNWLKEMLVGGIMSNLSGMFDSVNQQVADISVQVGQTPQGWNGNIFSMIENLSNSIMVPIAGVILAIVMTVDLIQMIADKNNLHDVDTWMIFKWVFKSAAAILIVTNTWNIVMGVFDMAQSVVAQAAGIINSDASIDISSVMTDLEPRLMEMDLGPLFGLWFQSLFIGITMWALYICIFIVIYGRMIEIYLVTSVAPVPMAAMMGKEWGGMGQNYLRSLLALGFQAFLIIVCVAIYAVLVQNIALEDDIIMAIWSCVGYTVLLCFTLFKPAASQISLSGALKRKEVSTLAYVPVPKDLTKVKTKVMFNLTKRQLICFTGGALIGVPLFFLLRKPTGNSVAAMCMMLVMLPFFMLAMYEKHGQPLEKIVGNILKVAVIRPKQRPYQTNNFYAVLKRQEMLDKEVYDIVHRNKKWLHRMFGKAEEKTMQPVKTKKKLSRADKKQIEAAIARANRTDKKENLRRTVSLMNGCGRTESAAYRTATTQRPFSFRTSTISSPKTKIRRQSLRVGVISSIILTARFISSCLFEPCGIGGDLC